MKIMTEREIWLKKLATYGFAMTDLHLFLDTHPNDAATAKKLQEYRAEAEKIRKEYEERFGPLTTSDENGNRWAWIQGPWPWEVKED